MSKSCQLHKKCPKVVNCTKNVQMYSITQKMSKCSYKIPTSHNPFQLWQNGDLPGDWSWGQACAGSKNHL